MANPILIVGGVVAAIWAFTRGKGAAAAPTVTPGGPAPATPGSGGLVPITPLIPHPSGVHDFPALPEQDPSVPDEEDPRLDADLPAALRAAILGVLDDPNSTADQLNMAADAADGAGHPIAAASLRAAAQAKGFAAGPPVNPGQTAPQPNPGNDPGIFPNIPDGSTPATLDPNLLGGAQSALDKIANQAAADAAANGDDGGDDVPTSFDPSQALDTPATGFSQAPAAPGNVTNDGDGGDATGSTIDSILSGLGF